MPVLCLYGSPATQQQPGWLPCRLFDLEDSQLQAGGYAATFSANFFPTAASSALSAKIPIEGNQQVLSRGQSLAGELVSGFL